MELEASNVVQTLVEMAATLDLSSFFTAHTCTHLARASSHKFPELSLNQQLLNQIVACMQLAWMHKPELQYQRF
jgi:hypothetical protein